MTDIFDLMDEWGPEKVVTVSDAKTGMKGVLVIDNTARGMGKGGTRMTPTLTIAEVARLARVMTWKWAAVDLFFGGAKAGLRWDPQRSDKEEALRVFARKLRNEVPSEYVFGLDVGLTEQDAAVLQDEVGVRGGSVGVPSVLGGMPYDQLGITGRGVAEAVNTILEISNRSIRDQRVSVQGFGAVGLATVEQLFREGATIVAVSTAAGALVDADGLDIDRLLELRSAHGDDCVHHYAGEVKPLGTELTVDTDVLIPAATQDVINGEMVDDIKAHTVVEGANLPITPDALDKLHARGTAVVPDFIANAGGVIAAAYSMESRDSPFRADPDAVLQTTLEKVRANVGTVADLATAEGIQSHAAARKLAQDRVREAMLLHNGGQATARA